MDSTMKERPILFNAEMVNAILAGNKTQTRREMKTQLVFGDVIEELPPFWYLPTGTESGIIYPNGKRQIHAMCPLGKVGDRLWVRESFYIGASMEHHTEKNRRVYVEYKPLSLNAIKYGHHGESKECMRPLGEAGPCQNIPTFRRDGAIRWRPSIHMPRWASRITLEITAVRVERLQDISEEDADAEGCERLDSGRDERDFSICPKCGGTGLHLSLRSGGGVCEDDCNECNTYKKRYQHLWSSIYGPESWDANPWVWIIEFKRITP